MYGYSDVGPIRCDRAWCLVTRRAAELYLQSLDSWQCWHSASSPRHRQNTEASESPRGGGRSRAPGPCRSRWGRPSAPATGGGRGWGDLTATLCCLSHLTDRAVEAGWMPHLGRACPGGWDADVPAHYGVSALQRRGVRPWGEGGGGRGRTRAYLLTCCGLLKSDGHLFDSSSA